MTVLSNRDGNGAANPLNTGTVLRVYTVQNSSAWDHARRVGHLTGYVRYVGRGYRRAYNWMREQMRSRVAGYTGRYPVWADLTPPDLFVYLSQPEPLVLIIADVPAERTLISDFEDWHFVLNGSPLPEPDELVDPDGPFLPRNAMRSTWQRVFDSDWRNVSLQTALANGRVLQLCIEKIDVDEVVAVWPVETVPC